MPQRAVELQFPLAGINRQFAYQSQPPYTTPDALNVRPWDPILRRERGGSRVGVERMLRTKFGSSSGGLRALDSLRYARTDGFTIFSDDFSQGLSSNWTAEFGSTLPTVTDGVAECADGDTVTAVHAAMSFTYSGAIPDAGLTVEALILPDAGKYQGTYRLFLYLDDTSPAKATDCFELEITTANGTTLTGHIRCLDSGVETWKETFSWTPTIVDAGWLRLSHLPGRYPTPTDGYVLATFRGRTLKLTGAKVPPVANNNGHRWGFEMEADQGGTGKIERVQFHYGHEDGHRSYRHALVGIADGQVWFEHTHHELEQARNPVADEIFRIDRTVFPTTTPVSDRVYIADHGGPQARETDTDTAVVQVYSPSGKNFTSLRWDRGDGWVNWSDDILGGGEPRDFGVFLSSTPSWLPSGCYRIVGVIATGTKLILHTNFDETDEHAIAGCKFFLARTAKVVNYLDDEDRLRLTPWGCESNPGTDYDPDDWDDPGAVYPLYLPIGFSIVSKYGNRMVVAGDPLAPWIVYYSRVNDEDDFDTGQTDAEAAVAISLLAFGNLEVTAALAFSDDYHVIGCPTSLWVLRGDPAYDPNFNNLAQNIGIVAPDAWTWLPDGRLIFLSHAGLYELAPGAGQYPRALSLDRLPAELRGINKETDRAVLAYDPIEEGVLITISPIDYAASTVTHWWYDPRREAFWRDELPRDIDPVCPLRGAFGKLSPPGLPYGGRDGYVYHRAQHRISDADTAIATNVLYGPLRLGGSPVNDGILNQIEARLGTESDDLTWAVQKGVTAQAAVAAGAFATGTFVGGENYAAHVRARAHAACIKLSTTASAKWALENLAIIVAPGGRHRKA